MTATDWERREQEMADLDELADNHPAAHRWAVAGTFAAPILLLLATAWVIGWWLF